MITCLRPLRMKSSASYGGRRATRSLVFFTPVWSLIVLLAMVSAGAAANGAWPCVGHPAMVTPGSALYLGAQASGTVHLVDDSGNRTELTVTANEAVDLEGTGVAQLPTTLAPGRYGLVLTTAQGEVLQPSAVFVRKEFPPSYTIVLLRASGTQMVDGPMFSTALIERLVATPADLYIVLGTLTTDGGVASYEALKALFATVPGPVFFCPDQAERARGAYETVFGPQDHAFRFGEDGYLFLGSGLSHNDVGTEARLGPIYRWRRVLRPSRWSVGVAGHIGLDWSMRSQLVLFVDDPLDYLIAGDSSTGMGARMPWGRTELVVAPAETAVQWVDVTPTGLSLRSPAVAAE